MSGQALRNFAIALLDDEHGISREAWSTLDDLLYDDDQNDILREVVKAQNGRFRLSKAAAKELRKVVISGQE